MHILLLLLQIVPIISGRVTTTDGIPLENVSVRIEGSSHGAATDAEGEFRIRLAEPGHHIVVFSAIGFEPVRREVEVGAAGRRLDVELGSSVLQQEEIVVTGTMRETYVSDAPAKVEVLPKAYLDRLSSSNITGVLDYVSGIQVQNECGICYTNSIRINGMDGPYTAVLIDGMPMMSALASVYGLNSISPAFVRQVEVMRGPASTLYGSEALAGVVNIITERPDYAPKLFVGIQTDSYLETSADVAGSFTRDGFGGLFSASGTWMQQFVDHNNDAFSDVPSIRNLSLFGALQRGHGLPDSRLSARFFTEDRFGGERGWTRENRFEVYGEYIVTNRFELLGSHRFGSGKRFKLDATYDFHDQDSYYGDATFLARQHSFASNITWAGPLSSSTDLLTGASLRYFNYEDDTPVRSEVDNRVVPGVFAQVDQAVSTWQFVLGMRIDAHRHHGVIPSPRFNVLWKPSDLTTIRLNTGTGFRVVNLFTEDHAAISGSRSIILEDDLEPERSWNATINLSHIIPFGTNPLVIDLDIFRTAFSNQILPDYDTQPGAILYRNLSGRAVTHGLTLNVSQSFTSIPFEYSIGMTLLDAVMLEQNSRDRIMYAPDYQIVATASYRDPATAVTFDYTARATGPMRLPEYAPPFERPTRSSAYAVHNLRLTRKLVHYESQNAHRDIEAFIGMNNILDYVQPSPLIDPANPFGDNFDTNYVYGPLQGRRLVVGLRFIIE